METLDRNGQQIRTVHDWQLLAGPTSPDQWRDGYSAKELAKAWAPDDGTGAAAVVTPLLREAFNDPTLELTTGRPEHRTRFDDNPRGPRVHDLLLQATTASGPVVIGVEGKGCESFGLPLGEHLVAAAANERSGTPARVRALVLGFFGGELDKLSTVGYQLLSALAGTLVEAKKATAVSAIVLVHEFRFDHSDEAARKSNLAQFETFIGALGTRLVAGQRSDDPWWITEPVEVRGANAMMADRTLVRLAKLTTDHRKLEGGPSGPGQGSRPGSATSHR